jgi:DNA-directed RNA polymerase specialized sigma24 family protein
MNQKDKTELDEQLKQLAIEAQSHPPLSKERREALTKLLKGIIESGRFYRPAPSRLPSNFYNAYEEIYDDAKQELMLHVCQKLDEYNPERGSVMTWVNLLMDRRFFPKAIGMFRDTREERVPDTIPTLDDLDSFEPESILNTEKPSSLSQDLRQYIEEDSENIFKKHFIREHPQVTFQLLLLQRLNGKSWKKISEEMAIPVPTLSTFYQRSLKKFAANFQEYLLP